MPWNPAPLPPEQPAPAPIAQAPIAQALERIRLAICPEQGWDPDELASRVEQLATEVRALRLQASELVTERQHHRRALEFYRLAAQAHSTEEPDLSPLVGPLASRLAERIGRREWAAVLRLLVAAVG